MKGQQRVEVDRLKRKAMRGSSGARLNGLSDNEMAARLRGSGDSFLASAEWKELRRLMVEKHGAKCMCCGFVPKHPWQINVDHVKPRRFYPELALDEGNLQVLRRWDPITTPQRKEDGRQKPSWDEVRAPNGGGVGPIGRARSMRL